MLFQRALILVFLFNFFGSFSQENLSTKYTFEALDSGPHFRNCSRLVQNVKSDSIKKLKLDKCFKKYLSSILKNNSHPELFNEIINNEAITVNAVFTVSKHGTVSHVTMQGSHQTLDTHFQRTLEKLQKIVPGKIEKENVNSEVHFSHTYPSIQLKKMSLPTSKPHKEKTLIFSEMGDDVAPPIFPGCERSKDKNECFSERIAGYVNKYFDLNIASKNGLKGLMRIYCTFTFDHIGKVGDIQIKAPHPAIKNEAARVIKKLPRIVPAAIDRKPVKFLFTLPIVFQVE